MMNKEQIIEDARKILDNSFSLEGKVLTFASSQTTPYYAHCKEQIRNAMIRMLEYDYPFYQLIYCCLGNKNTYEAKNKKSIPNKENDESWNNYFIVDYSRVNSFDKKKIKDLLYKHDELQFETAASSFHLIDDNTVSVIVNWKNSMDLVEKLLDEGPSYSLMKALSQFSVNVRDGDVKKLKEADAIEEVLEGIYVIRDRFFYSNEVGLITDNHWLEESLIV